MMEYIPCYSALAVHWDLLPATRLASRKILIEQNIKKRTGPALCVLSGLHRRRGVGGVGREGSTVHSKVCLNKGNMA